MATLGVNMQDVAANAGFSAVEKGVYPVVMTASDWKPTSNGSGKLLETHYKIQGGALHGRDIMLSFNWENNGPNGAKAVEIGRGQFRTVCDAVRVIPVDSQQLHNIPFNLEVDQSPEGKYNNFVNAYPIVQQQAAQQQHPMPAQPQRYAQAYQAPVEQYQQPQPQQYANPVQPQQYQAPSGQANPADPMAAYNALAQPAQPVQYQPQPQPQPQQGPVDAQGQPIPEWILAQQRAQAQQQPPMGNG